MAKNILILTGSPRKGGNSDLLADAFIAGAQQSGHTTVKYATAEKNIKGCKIVVPGVNEKGDILKTDGLKRAEKLGKSMI